MPDEINKEADVASKVFESAQSDADHLKSIDSSLKQMLDQMKNMSSANAKNRGFSSNPWSRSSPFNTNRFGRSNFDGAFDSFTAAFEKELLNNVVGDDFRNGLKDIKNQLIKDMGVSFEEIPQTLGKEVGKRLFDNFTKSKMGDDIISQVQGGLNKAMGKFTDAYNKKVHPTGGGISKSKLPSDINVSEMANMAESVAKVASSAESSTAAVGEAVSSMSTSAVGASAATEGLTAGLASVTGALSGVIPLIPLAIAGFKFQMMLTKPLRDLAKWVAGPTLEGLKKGFEAAAKAANRYESSMDANVEYAKKRIKDDVESMVKYPFEILNKAAQEWYATWDNNLKTITATQGYTKSDLQNLMSAFAERLRQEGLSY